VITAKKAGTANITVTTIDGGKTASCTVTVISWDVYNVSTWNEVVTRIKTGGNNKTYTINVTDDFSIPGLTVSNPYTFGIPERINVTITGDKEISLSTGSKGSLLYLCTHQTVIINDLRFKGHSTNTDPLVIILDDSSVTMQGSASVSGNTNTTTNPLSSVGGGVLVSTGGNFIMQGSSTVSGNTSSSNGGGVAVIGGSFTMQDNATVSGNTASGGKGGGVYVEDSYYGDEDDDRNFYVTFTMKGGTVYGNVAAPLGNNSMYSSYGAALYLQSDGTGNPVAKYSDGSNILPHTDGQANYTNNTITGR
jgi:parallel beta-helix repeat protein